ncbi:MAG: site-2 protease family protein [Armatimonadota bacterium]|nr:site-2 protease family protein [Armatimonadota bacterium]
MQETINGILSIAVVLGACIFFHELGHFALAKLIGMKVEEFALGFGWRLWGFRRGETVYRINAVPLGGYVRITGMEPGAERQERGFHSFPRWMGTGVLAAGSVMNVVLAALAFIAIGVVAGIPVFPSDEVNIAKVIPDSPAEAAGLRRGDQVLAMDGMRHSLMIADVGRGGLAQRAGLQRYDRVTRAGGEPVDTPPELLAAMIQARDAGRDSLPIEVTHYNENGDRIGEEDLTLPVPQGLPERATPGQAGPELESRLDLALAPLSQDTALAHITERPGERIALKVRRGDQRLQLGVVPRRERARIPEEDEEGRLDIVVREVGRVGVVLSPEMRSIPVTDAIGYGVLASIGAVHVVTKGLVEMMTGRMAPQASGPVGIAAVTAQRAQIGWTAVASILGIISANLAIINLFPIPPFDGFRIVLLAIEAIIGRRVNERIEIGVTVAGVAIILGFFVVITYIDIVNIVQMQAP